MDFERFYETMTGQIEPGEGYPVVNCFAGDCERLYGRITNARRRICAALDGNLTGENPQVLAMMDAYEAMQRIFCECAFAYGMRYGRGEIEL